jgi:Coenzyme PQQ synthesis protein D (PqqD)
VSAARVGPPPETVRALEIDGDISLYDRSTQHALLLNATASAIWRLADGERTLDELVDDLALAYRAAAAEIRPDVERTVRELTDAGFLPP